MDNPLVSVIIPAYNAEEFLEKTLISVREQTYQNLEIIIINDGSRDKTEDILKKIAAEDTRVILLSQANSGVAVARNLGIKHSKGEFIAPIDADDLWHPENIEKQVQCMLQSDPSVGVVYSWSVDINEKDVPLGGFCASNIEGDVYLTLMGHNFMGNASCTLIRRRCLETVGGYNEQLKQQKSQGCEDWDLYLRIAEYYQFRVVQEFLVGYRKIMRSMSTDYTQMARSQALMLQSVQEKHPEISPCLFRLSKSSFYMYLARQSSQYKEYKNTLFWLSQALKTEWITPLFRFGLYVLFMQNLIGLMFSSYPLIEDKKMKPELENIPQKTDTFPDYIPKNPFPLKFKLFLGKTFNKLILTMMNKKSVNYGKNS